MTIEEQVQFLKDQGVWEDFLIEIADGNVAKVTGSDIKSIVDFITWHNSRQGYHFWSSIHQHLVTPGSNFTWYSTCINYKTMLKCIQQWKEEYKEWFV